MFYTSVCRSECTHWLCGGCWIHDILTSSVKPLLMGIIWLLGFIKGTHEWHVLTEVTSNSLGKTFFQDRILLSRLALNSLCNLIWPGMVRLEPCVTNLALHWLLKLRCELYTALDNSTELCPGRLGPILPLPSWEDDAPVAATPVHWVLHPRQPGLYSETFSQ